MPLRTFNDCHMKDYEGPFIVTQDFVSLNIMNIFLKALAALQFTPGCVTSLLLMPSISACLSPEYLEAPLWQHSTWDFTLVKNGKHLQNQKAGWVLGTKCLALFCPTFLILGCHAASQSEVKWESHSRFASSAEAAGVATDVSGHWSMEVDRTRWNPFGLEQLLKQPNRFCQQDCQLSILLAAIVQSWCWQFPVEL